MVEKFSDAGQTPGQKRINQWHNSSLHLVVFSSGEVGFRAMSVSLLWAKRSMLDRVHLLAPDLPVTLVYGGQSWMDSATGERVARLRPNSYTHTVVSLKE